MITTPELQQQDRSPLGSDPCSPLPVGTRIRFLQTLYSGPDDFGPGNHYATKGQLGTVAESPYGPDAGPPHEGHWVFWDGWPSAQFGATLGEDFEIHSENAQANPSEE